MEWPFHPKYVGALTALVFFGLAIAAISYESAAEAAGQRGQVVYWAAWRTLFAFVGGAGFTAWLSMTVYEYVHWRGQDREASREFFVSMVKDLYGPIYDEITSNRQRLGEFEPLDLSANSRLEQTYLSIYVPPIVIDISHSLLSHGASYNERLGQIISALQSMVAEFAASYFVAKGGPHELPRLSGAEAKGILGANVSPNAESYRQFLEREQGRAQALGLKIDMDDFHGNLRRHIWDSQVAKDLFVRRINVTAWADTMMGQIKPLIRRPYQMQALPAMNPPNARSSNQMKTARDVLVTLGRRAATWLTAFFIFVFVVGQWSLPGTDPWLGVLWRFLLVGLLIFWGATWSPSDRWKPAVARAKWWLVFGTGFFLLLMGVIGIGIAPFAPGVYPDLSVFFVGLGILLLVQGVRMIVWAKKNWSP